MTTFAHPVICFACMHYNNDHAFNKMTCKAFPEGIPAEVRTGQSVHGQPIEGDHGIQFEFAGTTTAKRHLSNFYRWYNDPHRRIPQP